MMTNDQSRNVNGKEDKCKSELNDQSQNNEKRSEPLKNESGENENVDETNEDDEDDEDDDKSNSTKNSKNFTQTDNSCISCKKLKNAKKKPRSTKSSRRIGLRSVPKKYFSLTSNKQTTVRLEFNLDIPETKEPSEAPRIRLCLECFKKLLARLNELVSEELKSRQESKSNENVMGVSDDEYHDYDDDDEPVSESSEDPQENPILSTTSPNKTKIGSVSPIEKITISQNSFDSTFQAVENSKEKSKIMKIDHDDNNNSVDPKAPAKQISEVINDAIKTALQVSVGDKPKSPIESPVSSASSQNSSFFGSITKGTPVPPTESKPSAEKKPTSIDKNELIIQKQNDTPEVANGNSVLNDLIIQQLQNNLSKINNNTTNSQKSPSTVNDQNEEIDLDNEKKYTLGRWVDTIIVKMNDKPVDEIDMQKFKDQLPMSSNENSAAANLLKAKKGQSDESSCSSVASSPGNKTKQEILIDSDGEESNAKMDQQTEDKKESQGKMKNRIENIIENELTTINDDQTLRGRTNSLTMKLLQGMPRPSPSPGQNQTRPSPSPKRQSPSEKSDNWIGSMLSGVIMKSLNEELPPAVNIPPIETSRSPHIKSRQVSPSRPGPKPTKDLNLIAQARSYGQTGSNVPSHGIPSSPSPSAKKGFTPVPQKIPPAQPVPHRPMGQQYMNYPMTSPGPSRSASTNLSPSSMPQNSLAMFIQKELHDLDQQGNRPRHYTQRQPNQQMLSPSPPPPSLPPQPPSQQQIQSNSYNSISSPTNQNSGLTATQIANIIQAATSAASNSNNSAAAAAAAAAAAVACMNSNMFQSGSANGAESLIQSILSAASMMNQFQQSSESHGAKKMSHSSQSTPSSHHLMNDSHSYPTQISHHMPPHMSQHDHHVRSGLKSPQMHHGQMMHHSPEIIIQETGSNNHGRHHMQPHHSPSKSTSYGQSVMMPLYQHQMAPQMHHHEQQSFKKRLLSTSSMEQSMGKSQQFSRPSISGSHMIQSSMPPPSGGAFHQHSAYAAPPSSHHSQHLPPNYPKMLKTNQHSTIGPVLNSYHNQYEYMSDTEN